MCTKHERSCGTYELIKIVETLVRHKIVETLVRHAMSCCALDLAISPCHIVTLTFNIFPGLYCKV